MSNIFNIDNSSNMMLELTTTQALCSVINSPRALTVFLMIENKLFAELIDLECNPNDYINVAAFRDDYMITELLQKSINLPLGIDREQKALDSFWESESVCRETNDRLTDIEQPLTRSIHRVKQIVHSLLGPLSRNDLEFVQSHFRFGPGATTGVRGRGSVLSDKYDEEIHLTYELIPFYRVVLGQRWWDLRKFPRVVEGNKFTSVPKNAKTNRGICIEPTLNIYIQLGIGALLRKRLLRLGVDLSSQKKNQALARLAFSENLATIDLSKASDSLSWSAVLTLLPSDWFELLELSRCSHTNVDGNLVELEKFSSMGNGFTFELESLIFAAVAHACVPASQHTEKVSIYGDDIIVPASSANSVIETLNLLGFKVNHKKSFLAGSFFESCGTDWFEGQPVRPFYLKESRDIIPYPLQIANALRLYATRINHGEFCDIRFKGVWHALIKRIPPVWKKCRVPSTFGDSGVVSSFDEAAPRRAKNGLDGWTTRHMVFRPVEIRKRSHGRLLAALACPDPEISTYGREPRRGFLRIPRPKWSFIHEWPVGFDWG